MGVNTIKHCMHVENSQRFYKKCCILKITSVIMCAYNSSTVTWDYVAPWGLNISQPSLLGDFHPGQ